MQYTQLYVIKMLLFENYINNHFIGKPFWDATCASMIFNVVVKIVGNKMYRITYTHTFNENQKRKKTNTLLYKTIYVTANCFSVFEPKKTCIQYKWCEIRLCTLHTNRERERKKNRLSRCSETHIVKWRYKARRLNNSLLFNFIIGFILNFTKCILIMFYN